MVSDREIKAVMIIGSDVHFDRSSSPLLWEFH